MNHTRKQQNFTYTILGNKATNLVAFGRSVGWAFPVLGHAPIPTIPIYINNWLIVPAHLDNTPLPYRAQDRMNTILSAGFRPKDWLIIHEAPPLLTAPKTVQKQQSTMDWITPQTKKKSKKILKTTGSALGAVALATGTAAIAVAAVALIIPAFLIAGALVVDPILVAVSEDGFWVEIDRWDM